MAEKVKIRAQVAPVHGSASAMGITFRLSLPLDAQIYLAERGYSLISDGFTKVVICHRENIDGIFCAEEELLGEDYEIIPELEARPR